ncbi:amino acid transporter, partial [Trypanosoma cruzi]
QQRSPCTWRIRPLQALGEPPCSSITKFRCSSAAAHRLGAAWELGVQQGLIIAERQILGSDYTRAIAGVADRSAQLYSQVEEAHNHLSACESSIAVAGDLFAGRGDAVSTRGAHLSERAARWRKHTAAPTASFDGCGRASIHVSQTYSHGGETAGQYPKLSGQFWATTSPSLDAFALPHLPLGR